MSAPEKKTSTGVILFLATMFLLAIALLIELLMDIKGIIMASTLLLAVALFVAMKLLNAKKIRDAEDERMRKIDAYARGHAWSISMLLVIVVFILGMFNIIEINGFLITFAMFAVMGWSWIIFRAYYYFKGDVE